MILGVAIKHNDIMICLPKPNRHHDCIRYGTEVLGLSKPLRVSGENQGFYTVSGRYLNRQEAMEHARICNQIKVEKTHHSTDLFSEDLW